MRLTILGSSASYASGGRACAGYLVRAERAAVLFDCGNGTISNLSTVLDPVELDAVFVTHEHIDHFADIYALQAALRYAPTGAVAPLSLYAPPGLFASMGAVLGERGRIELAEAFDVHELHDARPVSVGALTITPYLVDHTDPTFALVAEESAARLVYTSDTRLGRAVRDAAAGASVLLADATLPDEYAGRSAHMTPGEAGELARDAGASTLVLTHLWPTVDRARAAGEAAESFRGRIVVANELDDIVVD
ncbi:MAG: MBL fold metallo-hydrolase [Coriobacteriia bacterium]